MKVYYLYDNEKMIDKKQRTSSTSSRLRHLQEFKETSKAQLAIFLSIQDRTSEQKRLNIFACNRKVAAELAER